jgi:hypothetical protein
MEMDQVATNTTAQIRKVTEMAEQTSTQLQGFQSSIADLIKLSAENASQQRESNSQMKSVQEDLQKLTNASAGRDPPKGGSGGWKDKITFSGKCFNCGIKGHKAEDCDKKARRRMVNAIASGDKEAKDQFSSSEA